VRFDPLVAQRRKDYEEVYLHQEEKWMPPSRQTLIYEALEWYCDLHNPIDTTPAHRLPYPDGHLDLQVTPHSDILPSERSIADHQRRIKDE
jgi:hypothetical protein